MIGFQIKGIRRSAASDIYEKAKICKGTWYKNRDFLRDSGFLIEYTRLVKEHPKGFVFEYTLNIKKYKDYLKNEPLTVAEQAKKFGVTRATMYNRLNKK